jgi:hypothetical protein
MFPVHYYFAFSQEFVPYPHQVVPRCHVIYFARNHDVTRLRQNEDVVSRLQRGDANGDGV